MELAEYIKITVQDEGCGIEKAYRCQIFDPYVTTKESGNGLGLATTYSIIKKHGGHISIVSHKGKGTMVTFYLPACKSSQTTENRKTQKKLYL